jgi:hypothetical protein
MPQNSFLDYKLKPRVENKPFREFITLKAEKKSSNTGETTILVGLVVTRSMGLA